MFMFCVDDRLGKNVGRHVVHPDEFEHDRSVSNAFPDVMVSPNVLTTILVMIWELPRQLIGTL